MRVVVQRVKKAHVSVGGTCVGQIEKGYLLLVGIASEDTSTDIEWMAKKVGSLRVFPDPDGKMNCTLGQAEGKILSVSQFTICADMKKGNRPGFDKAAKPEVAKKAWEKFNDLLRQTGFSVEEGQFGADMAVELTNDGPVTIWLDSKS